MANIQGFDQLNIVSRRSIPYEEYFADMALTKAQKEKRKSLALILEDVLLIFFEMYRSSLNMGTLNEVRIKQEFTYQLYDAIENSKEAEKYFESEDQLDKYVADTVRETYRTTAENLEKFPNDVVPIDGVTEDEVLQDAEETGTIPADKTEPYWTSTDRAEFIAENESNTLLNSAEFVEAKESGKTYKIWMSYGDDRVRLTHQIVDGAKVPIGTYFDVGRARMLYPKDVTSELSTGAECPEEVIGCRCSIRYV